MNGPEFRWFSPQVPRYRSSDSLRHSTHLVMTDSTEIQLPLIACVIPHTVGGKTIKRLEYQVTANQGHRYGQYPRPKKNAKKNTLHGFTCSFTVARKNSPINIKTHQSRRKEAFNLVGASIQITASVSRVDILRRIAWAYRFSSGQTVYSVCTETRNFDLEIFPWRQQDLA